ncbi:hypothetical protein TPHA_0M02090 [Tetrapisispora phaffii CBS 4417]|uniref:Uncharacterized protein n=1 Tax=Tetrapisispora phaffii (strain ATCC 24235 / CBS 4417 / NBRC 1672 / NRRL Y-8282 / UCD 70-5) TaxID=1071381 RepID=G8C0R8_TETPH|nr:hypothetical protein TPHA_0M02090 [Tetrapisispora phaffii CBS 4417]CCE65783.1 hypothetical protein TPHA_0M02090 [Tetrapisispora phaffii CBS 4417]
MNEAEFKPNNYEEVFVDDLKLTESAHIHSLLLNIDELNYEKIKRTILFYLEEVSEYAFIKYWKTILSINSNFIINSERRFRDLEEEPEDDRIMIHLLYDSLQELQYISMSKILLITDIILNDTFLSTICENMKLSHILRHLDPIIDDIIIKRLQIRNNYIPVESQLEEASKNIEKEFINIVASSNESNFWLKSSLLLEYADDNDRMKMLSLFITKLLISDKSILYLFPSSTNLEDVVNYLYKNNKLKNETMSFARYKALNWNNIFQVINKNISSEDVNAITPKSILFILALFNNIGIWKEFFGFPWDEDFVTTLLSFVRHFDERIKGSFLYSELNEQVIYQQNKLSEFHSEIPIFAYFNTITFLRFGFSKSVDMLSSDLKKLSIGIYDIPDNYLLTIMNNFEYLRNVIKEEATLINFTNNLLDQLMMQHPTTFEPLFQNINDLTILPLLLKKNEKKATYFNYFKENFDKINKMDIFLEALDIEDKLLFQKTEDPNKFTSVPKLNVNEIKLLINYLDEIVKSKVCTYTALELGQLLLETRNYLLKNEFDSTFDDKEYRLLMKFPKIILHDKFEGIELSENNLIIQKSVDNEVQKKLISLYKNELLLDDLIQYLIKLKLSTSIQDNELYCAFIYFLIFESDFFFQYPKTILEITAELWGLLIQNNVVEAVSLDVFCKIITKFQKSEDERLKLFATISSNIFNDKEIITLPKFLKTIKVNNPSNNTLFSSEMILESDNNANSKPTSFTRYFKDTPYSAKKDQIKPELVSDSKIYVLLLNLTEKNFTTNLKHFKVLVTPPYFTYFCRTILSKFISQTNDNKVFEKLIFGMNSKQLIECMIHETVSALLVLLDTDSCDISELHKLALWLGLITIAHDIEIANNILPLRQILIDSVENGYIDKVISTVCGILVHAKESHTFRFPNIWTSSILQELFQIYHLSVLSIPHLFEIEFLFNELFGNIKNFKMPELVAEYDRLSENDIPLGKKINNTKIEPQLSRKSVNHLTVFRIDKISNKATSTSILAIVSNLVGSSTLVSNKDLRETFGMAISKSVYTVVTNLYETGFEHVLPICLMETEKLYNVDMNEERLNLIIVEIMNKVPLKKLLLDATQCIKVDTKQNMELLCSMNSLKDLSMETDIDGTLQENESLIYKIFSSLLTELFFYEIKKFIMQKHKSELDSQDNIKCLREALKVSNLQKNNHQINNISMTAIKNETMAHDTPPGLSIISNQVARKPTVHNYLTTPENDDKNAVAHLINLYLRNLKSNILNSTDNGINLNGVISLNIQICTKILELFPKYNTNAELKSIIFHEVFQLLVITQNDSFKEIMFQFLKEFKHEFSNFKVFINWWFIKFLPLHPIYSKELLRFSFEKIIGNEDLDFILSSILLTNRSSSFIEFLCEFFFQCISNKSEMLLKSEFISTVEALSRFNNDAAKHVLNVFDSYSLLQNIESSSQTKKNKYILILIEFISLLKNSSTEGKVILVFLKQLFQKKVFCDTNDLIEFFNILLQYSEQMFTASTSATDALLVVDAVVVLFMNLLIYLDIDNLLRKDVVELFMSQISFHFNEQHNINKLNERFYFRLYSSLLCQWSSMVTDDFKSVENESIQHDLKEFIPIFYNTITSALHSFQPVLFPGFSFAFLSLISHRMLLPFYLQNESYWMDITLLFGDVLKFIDLYSTQEYVSTIIEVLTNGMINIFEKISDEYPQYLIANHSQLIALLPESSVKLKNIVLSSSPVGFETECYRKELDETVVNDSSAPSIKTDPTLIISRIKKPLVSYIRMPSSSSLMQINKDIYLRNLKTVNGIGYNVITVDPKKIRAIILFILIQLANELKKLSYKVVFNLNSSYYTLLKSMIFVDGSDKEEVRYRLISVIVEQLRYPNIHTFWCIYFLENIYQNHDETDDEIVLKEVQEIILRCIFERLLIVNDGPYPWGCVELLIHLINLRKVDITDLQLIKNNATFKSKLEQFF